MGSRARRRSAAVVGPAARRLSAGVIGAAARSAVRVLTASLAAVAILTSPTALPTQAANGSVSIVDFAFEPDILTIASGATVTWTVTRARDPHTVTPTDPADAFVGSALLRQGDTFAVTFTSPGTYRYICSIHPEEMRGTIMVAALSTTSPTDTNAATSAGPTGSVPTTSVPATSVPATSSGAAPTPLAPTPTPVPPTAGDGIGGVPVVALAGAAALGALIVALAVANARRRPG